MGDLKDPRLIYLKGSLFLFGGFLAGGLLLAEAPTLTAAFLLAVTVWCFARFYYFAFYVIEHYVDPGYRFAGLWSFARYLWARRRGTGPGRGIAAPEAPSGTTADRPPGSTDTPG